MSGSNAAGLRTSYSNIRYQYLDLLGMFWVTALMVSTFAASKLVAFGSIIQPGTIIVYSITYIFSDIFTEVYGYKATRRIIWTGMALLVFANIVFYIISVLPPAPGWNDQKAFETIFQTAPIYTAATIAGYFSGEFTNSYIMAKMKIFTNGRWLWSRTIGSSAVAMLVDYTMFALIAYSWSLPFKDWIFMLLIGWPICVAYEILMTPVTYKIVGWLKKAEGVDIYDTDTDFNPFHVSKA